nr:tyrosine-type recombinase/integrase [Phosphitispora fastidiosa]
MPENIPIFPAGESKGGCNVPGKGKNNIIPRGANRWLIRYELPRDPQTGKRRQKALTVKGTKKDAERKLREKLQEVDNGNFVVPSSITIEQYMLNWLDKYEVNYPVAKTHKTAQSLITNHVINELGAMKLSDLQAYHINTLFTYLGKRKNKGGKGLSSRTRRYIYWLFRKALDEAVDINLISNNPILKVKQPRLRQREVKPLLDEERNRFLEAIKDNRFENLFIVALGTGVRFQELLNLTWSQISFEERSIVILNLRDDDEENELFETDGKRECSKRTIPMFPAVYKGLKAQKTIQAKEKLLAGSLWEDNNLVFANNLGKALNQSNVRNRYFKSALEKAGLPINTHFHALRHTFVTTLIRKGEDLRKVSYLVGHKTPEFTFKKYHHYLPTKIETAESERMNNHLFG